MKKVINFMVLALFLNTMSVLAKVNAPEEDLPQAMKEISVMLNDYFEPSGIEIEKGTTVKVIFTVNSDNEIVVLDVRTKSKEVKNFVKSKLNSKMLNSGDLITGKQYLFQLKF